MQKLLTEKEATLQKLVSRHNALGVEQQEILQECLRVEGEIRLLKSLVKESDNGG